MVGYYSLKMLIHQTPNSIEQHHFHISFLHSKTFSHYLDIFYKNPLQDEMNYPPHQSIIYNYHPIQNNPIPLHQKPNLN